MLVIGSSDGGSAGVGVVAGPVDLAAPGGPASAGRQGPAQGGGAGPTADERGASTVEAQGGKGGGGMKQTFVGARPGSSGGAGGAATGPTTPVDGVLARATTAGLAASPSPLASQSAVPTARPAAPALVPAPPAAPAAPTGGPPPSSGGTPAVGAPGPAPGLASEPAPALAPLDEAEMAAKAARRSLLASNRAVLAGLPTGELFEIPGRPTVAFRIKDYSVTDTARDLRGREAARKDVPFLFRAFETGQPRPPAPGSARAQAPRAFTIHEYLDWTVTAAEPTCLEDLDFGGFRVLCLYPRWFPAYPSPGLHDLEEKWDYEPGFRDRDSGAPAAAGDASDPGRTPTGSSDAPCSSDEGGTTAAEEGGAAGGGRAANGAGTRVAGPVGPAVEGAGRALPEPPSGGGGASAAAAAAGDSGGRAPLTSLDADPRHVHRALPAARALELLRPPLRPVPAVRTHAPPITAATVRLGAGFLEVPFYATHETKRNRGNGRALLEAIEAVCRATSTKRILLCSTDDARTKATWRHLGFSETTEEQLEAWGVSKYDLLHMDNTVQMHKEVPDAPPAWRSIIVRHEHLRRRVYYPAALGRDGGPSGLAAVRACEKALAARLAEERRGPVKKPAKKRARKRA